MDNLKSLYHYLPVNDSVWRWGIYLTGIGRGAALPGRDYPHEEHPALYDFSWSKGRTLPEFAAVLVSSGQGVFESERTGTAEVRAGNLLFLFPGVWHRYRPAKETGWTERWMTFNGELAHRLIQQGLIQPETAVREVPAPATAEQALDDLLRKVHADPAHNSVLISLHTMGCLGRLIETAKGRKQDGMMDFSLRSGPISDPLTAETLDFIWTRSHHTLSVPRIARAMGVSRRTLERRFRAVLGHSILQEINTCRISRAKRLLVKTTLPIKAVSLLAGFQSEERMRLGFLAYERVSPTTYRQRARRRR